MWCSSRDSYRCEPFEDGQDQWRGTAIAGRIPGWPDYALGLGTPSVAICQIESASTDLSPVLPSYPRFPSPLSGHFGQLRLVTPAWGLSPHSDWPDANFLPLGQLSGSPDMPLETLRAHACVVRTCQVGRLVIASCTRCYLLQIRCCLPDADDPTQSTRSAVGANAVVWMARWILS
jgi:hypothetical protein